MSNREIVPINVHLSKWVEEAKTDPVLYRIRKVTEILLHAVGLSPVLRSTLVLKGGTLLNTVFGSPRATTDVDFSADADPEKLPPLLEDELNRALKRAAADLGYTDLICQVQTLKYQPRRDGFEQMQSPALKVTVGSAERGTSEETRLDRGQAIHVLSVDISFKEPLIDQQEIKLDDLEVTLKAYSAFEVLSEKLRAVLQQKIRNRSRRQDVYDIAFLIETVSINEEDKEKILHILIEKCEARSFTPYKEQIDDPEISERSQREWDTLRLELRDPLPDFSERFAIVQAFYKSLPWDSLE